VRSPRRRRSRGRGLLGSGPGPAGRRAVRRPAGRPAGPGGRPARPPPRPRPPSGGPGRGPGPRSSGARASPCRPSAAGSRTIGVASASARSTAASNSARPRGTDSGRIPPRDIRSTSASVSRLVMPPVGTQGPHAIEVVGRPVAARPRGERVQERVGRRVVALPRTADLPGDRREHDEAGQIRVPGRLVESTTASTFGRRTASIRSGVSEDTTPSSMTPARWTTAVSGRSAGTAATSSATASGSDTSHAAKLTSAPNPSSCARSSVAPGACSPRRPASRQMPHPALRDQVPRRLGAQAARRPGHQDGVFGVPGRGERQDDFADVPRLGDVPERLSGQPQVPGRDRQGSEDPLLEQSDQRCGASPRSGPVRLRRGRTPCRRPRCDRRGPARVRGRRSCPSPGTGRPARSDAATRRRTPGQ